MCCTENINTKVYMDKLISTLLPTTKKSWSMPRSPDVPQDNDNAFIKQGNSPHYSGEPHSYFRQMLPPAPRAQDLTEPSQTKPYSKFFQNRYKRGNMYYVASQNQNTMGIIDGGPSNANWVRGNEFAVDYNYKNIWGRPKVELKSLPKKPTTLANVIPSPFYPFPTFFDRNDRLYKSYPDQRNSYFGFLPFYTYPYNTSNNTDRIFTQEKNEQTKLQLTEGFTNQQYVVEDFATKLMKPIPIVSIITLVILITAIVLYNKIM